MIDDGSTLGEVTRPGGARRHPVRRHLPVPPPVVWVALTDPDFLSKWWGEVTSTHFIVIYNFLKLCFVFWGCNFLDGEGADFWTLPSSLSTV